MPWPLLRLRSRPIRRSLHIRAQSARWRRDASLESLEPRILLARQVSGVISSDDIWEGTIHVTNDVTVSASLTINPGTVVKFAPRAMLNVSGSLNAQGSFDQVIYFTDDDDDSVGEDLTPGVAGEPIVGGWESLVLNGNSTLDHVEVRYAGDNNFTSGFGRVPAVQIGGDNAGNVLRNVTVTDVADVGIQLLRGQPTLSDVHVQRSSANVAFQWNVAADPIASEISANDNQWNQIQIVGSSFPQATRSLAPAGNLPYHFASDFQVPQTLNIAPGTILKFVDGSLFNVTGTLNAVGTESQPIIFTSDNDDLAGGDSNGDAAGTIPGPGDWEAIYLSNASTLSHVDIRYAGDSNGTSGSGQVPAVRLSASNDLNTFADVRILNVADIGLELTAGTPRLERVHVAGLANNVPFVWNVAAAPIVQDLSGANNRFNRIDILGGSFPQSERTLDSGGSLPFFFRSDFTIANDSSLAIVPGTVIKINAGNWINVAERGQLRAEGTIADPIYFTSIFDDTVGGDSNGDGSATAGQAGNWEALYLTGASSFDHVEVRFAGDTNFISGFGETPAVQLRANNDQNVLRNVRVVDVSDVGIELERGRPTLEQVHVEGAVGNVPFRWSVAADPIVSGLTTARNRYERIDIVGGAFPQTVRRLDSTGPLPFYFSSDFSVNNGSTLTIAPGTVIVMNNATWFSVVSGGSLIAPGTATLPIIFTSLRDDSAGGDTNGDGNGSLPAAGDWEALYLNGSSLLEHVEVRFAGDTNFTSGFGETPAVQLRANNDQNVLRHVSVKDVSDVGIELATGRPTLEQVHVEGADRNVPFRWNVNADPIVSLLTTARNRYDRIDIVGGVFPQATRTLDAASTLPFFLNSDLTVQSGRSLTIVPGTVIKMNDAAWISVAAGATLDATGAPNQPIVVTSLRDDSVGGDSNGDGTGSSPAAGDWEALYLNGTTTLEHVELRYAGDTNFNAGFGDVEAIRVNTNTAISHLTLRHTKSHGIRVVGGNSIELHDSLLNNIGGAAVWVDAGSATITDTGIFAADTGVLIDPGQVASATGSAFETFNNVAVNHLNATSDANALFANNWWGHSGGPHDASDVDGIQNLNPDGSPISNFVRYTNFLTNRPAISVGPIVTSISPLVTNQPISTIDVTFSEPIDVATFTAADVQVTGPTATAVASIAALSANIFRLSLATPLTANA